MFPLAVEELILVFPFKIIAPAVDPIETAPPETIEE